MKKPFKDIFEVIEKGEKLVFTKSISFIWPEKITENWHYLNPAISLWKIFFLIFNWFVVKYER